MTGVEWVFQQLTAAPDVTNFAGSRIFPHREVGEQPPWVAFYMTGQEGDKDLGGTSLGFEFVRVEYGAEDWEAITDFGRAIDAALDVWPGDRTDGADNPKQEETLPTLFRAWREYRIFIPDTE